MARVSEAHLAARRQSILDAAARVFSQRGFQATTMAEVAREAGISPGAIYRYFPGKDELAHGCFLAGSQAVYDQWYTDDLAASTDPMGEFGELSRLTFGLLNAPEEREATVLSMEHMLAGVRNGDHESLEHLREERAKIREAVTAKMLAAQAAGQVSRGLDAQLLAKALLSFYWGARLAHLLDEDPETDGQLEQLMALMELAGPRPRS